MSEKVNVQSLGYITPNVNNVTKVENISNEAISFGPYTMLPGQIMIVDDRYWYGKEIWRKYKGKLKAYNRRDTSVSEDTTHKETTLTYAVNKYNEVKESQSPVEVTVDGVTYNGFTVRVGQNILIFLKEGVVTPVEVSGVDITDETKSITVDETWTMTATVSPSDATNKALHYLSEDETIATVSNKGKVTGVSEGTVDVHAISDANPEKSDYVTVTVTASEP